MRQLVLGIDYGTSNSGVAYSLFDDNDDLTPSNVDISVIKDLARGPYGQDTSEKLPSDIAYDDDWLPLGYGWNIPLEANCLQWVKLLLEPRGLKEKSNIQRLWKTYDTLSSNKWPEAVVADYLKWLWTRAKTSVINKLDEDDVFEKANLTVVLTVPASWSEKGKQRMMRAAAISGIAEEAHTIRLVPEAEAAAIFGLKWQAQKAVINEDDCVIICDAGGGTVDVVAYEILSRHPLSIDQRTASKGAFCGSVFIDLEFQNQLRSILGAEYDTLDLETRRHIENKFEYDIKRSYHPQSPETPSHYSIPLPARQDMTVETQVVDQAFQAIMTPIETLIEDQIDRLRRKGLEEKLRGILLVGGLSRSEYVYHRIHDGYASKKLKVWRADDAWTAVAQGAVYCETTAVIHSRLSRHNYGILYRQGDAKKVHWIVKKGQSVKSHMPTKPYAIRMDDQPWLDEDEYFRLRVTLVRSNLDKVVEEFHEDQVKPHAVVDCRIPTRIRFSDTATLVEEDPRVWHIPARFIPILHGAVISFRCEVEEEEVGITELDFFDDEGPDQDFHPDPDAISITPTPKLARTGTQDDDRSIQPIPTNSSSGQTTRRRIRDYHFNTRLDRDTPPEQRPRPGTLPGLYARGWIPRKDFYVDFEPES